MSDFHGSKIGRCKTCASLLNKKNYQEKKEKGELKVKYDKNPWTAEEIDIMRLCWANPEKTWRDVSALTGRTEDMIYSKAKALGLKKAKVSDFVVPDGHKYCRKCEMPRPICFFDKKSYVCKMCQEIKWKEKQKEVTSKICYKCNEEKLIDAFSKSRGRYTNKCKECKNKEYQQYILQRMERKGY
jgi:hypothetical protein